MDVIKKKFPKTLTTNWRFQHQANKESGKITNNNNVLTDLGKLGHQNPKAH